MYLFGQSIVPCNDNTDQAVFHGNDNIDRAVFNIFEKALKIENCPKIIVVYRLHGNIDCSKKYIIPNFNFLSNNWCNFDINPIKGRPIKS